MHVLHVHARDQVTALFEAAAHKSYLTHKGVGGGSCRSHSTCFHQTAPLCVGASQQSYLGHGPGHIYSSPAPAILLPPLVPKASRQPERLLRPAYTRVPHSAQHQLTTTLPRSTRSTLSARLACPAAHACAGKRQTSMFIAERGVPWVIFGRRDRGVGGHRAPSPLQPPFTPKQPQP